MNSKNELLKERLKGIEDLKSSYERMHKLGVSLSNVANSALKGDAEKTATAAMEELVSLCTALQISTAEVIVQREELGENKIKELRVGKRKREEIEEETAEENDTMEMDDESEGNKFGF